MVTCNSPSKYLIGSASVITVNITRNGLLVDPTTLMFEYEQPDGSVATIEYNVVIRPNIAMPGASIIAYQELYIAPTDIVKKSTGVYAITVVLSQAGTWRYRWQSTAPNHGAIEGTLIVTPSIIS